MNINKLQWEELSYIQKDVFQDEIGKIYKEDEYPTCEDILIFAIRKKIIKETESEKVKISELLKKMDILWNQTLEFLKEFHPDPDSSKLN